MTTFAEFIKRRNPQRRFLVHTQFAPASDPASTFLVRMNDFPSNYLTNPHRTIISSVPTLKRTLQEAFTGKSSDTWGTLTIFRENGKHLTPDRVWKIDDILTGDLLVRGQPVLIYYGGDDMPESEYQLIFSGYVRHITGWDNTTIKIEVQDRTESLKEKVIAPNTVQAGTNVPTDSVGKVIPVVLGNCYGITPVLVDRVNYIYQYSDTSIFPVQSVNAVYVNGYQWPATDYTVDLSNGKVTLAYRPTGDVTMDVSGAKYSGVFKNKIGEIAEGVLKAVGGFSEDDIDSAYLSAFNIDVQYPVGLYVNEKMTISQCFDRLISGIPAWYTFTRSGVFRIGQFALPSGTPKFVFRENFPLVKNSLSGETEKRLLKSQTIKYGRNYTPLRQISSSITDLDRVSWLSNEWRETKYSDSSVAVKFPLATDGEAKESCIVNSADASAVAAMHTSIFGRYNNIYSIKAKPFNLDYELHDEISLVDAKFGLDIGKSYRIIEISDDHSGNTVSMRLWGG